MNKISCNILQIILGLCLISSVGWGQILNGNFETPDPNSPAYFTAPADWERIPNPVTDYNEECYAGLHHRFDPNRPDDIDWIISCPYEGENFVVLSSGGFGTVRDDDIKGASISQEVFLSEGDTILGAYFFGAGDYLKFPNSGCYNDYGRIYIQLSDPNYVHTDPNYPGSTLEEFTIPGTYRDIQGVGGDYRSTYDLSPDTNGWITFSYTVEPNHIGPHYLRCEIVDAIDSDLTSYYAVDGLRICKNQPAADLNDDCTVDLADYSILSEAWLAYCPDPPYDPNIVDPNSITTDPNIPCQEADIDDSWYVDIGDLIKMSNDWLF